MSESVLVCHTPGCSNADVAVTFEMSYLDDETGNQVTITTAVCGVCGQGITDITDATGNQTRVDAPADDPE